MPEASGRLTAGKTVDCPRHKALLTRASSHTLLWPSAVVVGGIIGGIAFRRDAVPVAVETARASAADGRSDVVVIVTAGNRVATAKPAAKINIGAAL